MSLVSSRLVVKRSAVAAPLAVTLLGAGDPDASRLVYAMVIGLVVVGLALVFLGVWILRQTRSDLEVLAPLERMGDGDWKKRDPSTQRRMLDELRPAGARPLTPEPMPPPIDEEFEHAAPRVSSFSDLGPGVAAEQPDATLPELEESDPTPQELDTVEFAPDVADGDEALSDPRG